MIFMSLHVMWLTECHIAMSKPEQEYAAHNCTSNSNSFAEQNHVKSVTYIFVIVAIVL